MKRFLFVSALTLCLALPEVARADQSVEILLEHYPNPHREYRPTHIQLTQDVTGFRCKTDQVPEHRIQVRGLAGLVAPVTQKRILPGCKTVLTWGNSKFCYLQHEHPEIDEMIQRCLSI